MRILVAVILDLWHFSRAVFGIPSSAAEPSERLSALPAPAVPPSLLPPLHPSVMESGSIDAVAVSCSPGSAKQAFYTLVTVTVHHEPTVAFDNRVAVLPQGTLIEVGRRSGRFIYITSGGVVGWVDAEAVGEAAGAFPQFSRGRFYGAEDAETIKLRTFIDDAFLGDSTKAMLQGVEYVTYRVMQAGRAVPWGESWGRIAGTWQRKLRGVRGVRIDVSPRTGSIMEYIIDDVGYIAYVERVSPDLKITITGVGLTHEGQYTEQVMDHTIWRELRPVFITVS